MVDWIRTNRGSSHVFVWDYYLHHINIGPPLIFCYHNILFVVIRWQSTTFSLSGTSCVSYYCYFTTPPQQTSTATSTKYPLILKQIMAASSEEEDVASGNHEKKYFGRYITERLIVEPWKLQLTSDGDDKDNNNITASTLTRNVMSELKNGILDEEVTSFLPPSLVFIPGKTSIQTWSETFHDGSDVSTIRYKNDEEGPASSSSSSPSPLAGVLLLKQEESSDESENELHIGYIFGKKFWGKGLATELLKGLMKSLVEVVGYKGKVVGGVDPSNIASSKVLMKVGFSEVQPKDVGNRPTGVDWYLRTFS